MNRLAILSTHPIQYNAPLFRMLAADDAIDLKVFYSKKSEEVRFDKDFGREIEWDIPLTDGYVHESFAASTQSGSRALIQAIEAFQPEALLVYGWNFPGHWKAMRHFKRKTRVWFRGDSTLIDPLPFWKKWIRKALLTLVYRSIDKAFYVGQANKRYFLWCGLNESQLVYAPHAVDNEFFMRDDAARRLEARKIRADLKIPVDTTVFLFVGKLEPKKQPDMLCEAFLGMQDGTDAHLILVGSGELELSLKQQFGHHSNIHFVGFQNQQSMPIWYRVGNVLCLPSKGPGETWGLAVNEAMACGCSAIVSDRVGCGEDLIPDFGYGGIFPFDSTEQLKQSLVSQLGQPKDPYQVKSHISRWSMISFLQCIKSEL